MLAHGPLPLPLGEVKRARDIRYLPLPKGEGGARGAAAAREGEGLRSVRRNYGDIGQLRLQVYGSDRQLTDQPG